MIRLLSPWTLVALLVPLGLLLITRRKELWGRAVTMALLVLALAHPQVARRDVDPEVFLLVDRSRSVSAAVEEAYGGLSDTLRGHAGPIGLVGFATHAALIRAPGPGLPELGPGPPPAETLDTNIAAAVDLALGVAEGAPAHLVLVSDGQETTGDLWAAALRARQRGVPISALPVGVDDPVRVASLEGPLQAPLGSVMLEGRIEASAEREAELRWWADGELQLREAKTLSPGTHRVTFRSRLDRRGPHTFALEVHVEDDPFPENNRLDWLVMAGEAAAALVVGGSGAATQLLEDAGLDTRMSASFVPTDLSGVDVVVFDNWPLAGLSRTDIAALRTYVAGGGNLLVIQGRRAVEGYAGAVETLLPVTYTVPGRLQEATTAIVFVLDRSASMAATTAGAAHIDLLKEATASAVETMDEEDIVGAIAFDRHPSWMVRPGPTGEVAEAFFGALRALAPGGGTDLVPATREALAALEDIDTRIRHLVILSDGKTLPRPDLNDLYEEVATAGVGVTSIALGQGADLVALDALAQAGEGELIVVSDARDLRRVFIGEAERALRPRYREGEFSVTAGPGAASLGIEGVNMPAVEGYLLTFPKSTAEVGLIAPDGDPLMAGWQLGLGRVGVLNVDLSGAWTAGWMDAPSLGELWGALVGWLWSPKDDVAVNWSLDEGDVRVTLDIQAEGRWVSGLQLQGELVGPGTPVELAFRPTEPGRYEACVRHSSAGPHLLSVWDEQGRYGTTVGLALPYPQELASTGIDLETLYALTEFTGGRLLGDELPPTTATGRSWVPVERSFLWAAATAFLADLALRKLRFPSRKGTRAAAQ